MVTSPSRVRQRRRLLWKPAHHSCQRRHLHRGAEESGPMAAPARPSGVTRRRLLLLEPRVAVEEGAVKEATRP